jgi:spore coat polysaccharide biosynthesis predicted glycosyltransferase SpsG
LIQARVFSLIPDYGDEVGLGHLSRICALAMALVDEGEKVKIDAPKSKVKTLLAPGYLSKIKFGKTVTDDFVVVDSYREKKLPEKFVVFEDYKIDWQKKAGLKIHEICLRVPYFENKNIKIEKRALILLKPFLKKEACKKFLDVFIVEALKYVDKIDVVEANFSYKHKAVKLHKVLGSKELYELMQKSRFAFSYGGQSSLELNALGCPLLTYEEYENQHENIKILSKLSNVIVTDKNASSLMRLDNIGQNLVKLSKIRRKQNRKIMGGAKRTAKKIINYFK